MKKILMLLSAVSLLGFVGCNRSEKSVEKDIQREEVRDVNEASDHMESTDQGTFDQGTIEREESMDYEADDRLGRPVDEVEVEEVERRIED